MRVSSIFCVLLLCGCGAFPTPSIKKNGAVLSDGLEVLARENPDSVLTQELALCAEINEEVLGSPKIRIPIEDLPAIKANREKAKATIETGSNVMAWSLGIGGMVAGVFGAAGIQKFLNRAAAKHKGDADAA